MRTQPAHQARFVQPAFPGCGQHLWAPAHRGQCRGERTAGEHRIGADEAVDGQGDVLGQLLDGEVRPQVVRDGVEAAGMHDARPRLAGPCVVLQIHPVDELRLAREVRVVRPCLRARGDELLAVTDVRPHRRGHHPGGGGQFGQCLRVVRVGLQQRQVRAAGGDRGEPFPQPLQLGPAATGQRPAQAGGGVGRQVLGRERPHEAGGTEEDDVQGACRVVLPVHEYLRCEPGADVAARG